MSRVSGGFAGRPADERAAAVAVAASVGTVADPTSERVLLGSGRCLLRRPSLLAVAETAGAVPREAAEPRRGSG